MLIIQGGNLLMLKFKLNKLFFIVLSLSVFTIQAQDQSSESADAIEEVITTARRVEESITDVPIAISAFTGSDLENRGITNMENLASIVSNINFQKSAGNQSVANVSVRGMGSQRGNIQWDNKIAIYVDDAYMIRPQGSLFDLFDVNNLQVLKGPQGTLFGKNTSSGAILVNNNLPVIGEFDSSVKVSMGQRNLNSVSAMVNIPLLSNAALRVVGITKKQDGYINNLDGFGDDGGIIDNETFRAMLSVDITEDLNLLYTYSMFDSSGTPVYANCEVYTTSPMLAGGPALNFVPNDMKTRAVEDCNATGHYDSYHDSTFGDSYLDLDKTLLKLTYDLGSDSTLTFIHATAKHDDQETAWATGASRYDFADITSVGPRVQDTDGSTTEIRLTGLAMDNKLQYAFGYFESEVDGNAINQTIRAVGFEASTQLIGPGQAAPPLVGLPRNIGDIAKVALFQNSSGVEYTHSRAISEAVYGEVVYSLTDKLNLTLGYRSSEDIKGIDIRAVYPEGGMNLNPVYHAFALRNINPALIGLANLTAPYMDAGKDAWEISLAPTPGARYHASKCDPVYGSFSNPLTGGTGYCSIERTYDNDSMRFIADYTFDNGNMIYASYSEGYMPGNTNNSVLGVGAKTLESEITEVIEFGTKSLFMDGRLRFNAAVFNQDFSNKSVVSSALDANGQAIIINTIQPTVEMSGYEFDISYDLTESLVLGVSVGHVEGDNPASNLEYNVDGQNDSSNISLSHRGMIGKIPTVTVLRANTVGDDIMSENPLNCGPIPLYEGCAANGGTNQITNPEYTLANLNINLMLSEKAQVSFFVDNITDEEYRYASFGEITTTLGTISWFSGPPRTTGISVTVNY